MCCSRNENGAHHTEKFEFPSCFRSSVHPTPPPLKFGKSLKMQLFSSDNAQRVQNATFQANKKFVDMLPISTRIVHRRVQKCRFFPGGRFILEIYAFENLLSEIWTSGTNLRGLKDLIPLIMMMMLTLGKIYALSIMLNAVGLGLIHI